MRVPHNDANFGIGTLAAVRGPELVPEAGNKTDAPENEADAVLRGLRRWIDRGGDYSPNSRAMLHCAAAGVAPVNSSGASAAGMCIADI